MKISGKIFSLLLGHDNNYSNEYNYCKSLNSFKIQKSTLPIHIYFLKIYFAKLKGRDPKLVPKPAGYRSVPIIQSQNSHRPGEKNFLKTLMNYDIISFDIFDTSVFRNVSDPRDVFQIMGSKMGFENFKSIRIEAEKEARIISYTDNNTSEITLSDIYAILEKKYGIDKKWMDYEIELETYLCVSNLYVKRLFDKLIAAGKKVIFTSDMYLPKKVIENILSKNSFKDYDNLFLSCDLKKSKKDGSVYRYIKSIYGDNKKYYHIGDNYRYDIRNAKEAGFSTYYYRSVKEQSKEYLPEHYFDLSESFSNAVVNNALMNGTWNKSPHYECGFSIGGIMVAGYCEFLNSLVQKHGIDQILFCARDCDIIYKIYNKNYKKVDNDYIYVSRYSLMNVAPERHFSDLCNRAIAKIKDMNGSVRQLLESIEIDYLSDNLSEHGIELGNQVTNDNEFLIKKLILDNIETIVSHNRTQIDAAEKYFKSIIGKHKNILIVDVGWTGSCISILKYFLKEKISQNLSISGALLFGSNNEQLGISYSSCQTDVYISAPTKNLDLSKTQFDKENEQRNNQIFEYMFTSIEGSTIRYELDDEKNPIIIKNQRPCPNPKEIIDMQNGMIEFTDKYEKYSKKVRSQFTISPYVAYAPFKKILSDNEYILQIFSNFLYDAAIFQGKNQTANTFGKTFFLSNVDKKKVLLVSHSFSYTGAPHSLLRIGKVLVDSGYSCEVWSPHHGPLESDFKNNGINVRIIPTNCLYDSNIVRTIKTFDCAIINTILTHEYYSKIARYIPSIWYIREASNVPDYCTMQHNLKMLNCLKRADTIYCVSNYASSYLQKYNKNVKVVHNCIEDRSSLVKSERPYHSTIRFLQLGSIEPRKGYDVLLDAFSALPEKLKSQAELFFAGQITPNNKEYGESIVSKSLKMENVHYLGKINNDAEIANLENESDVIVVASLDESCSLVALEATMMSKALIITENVGAKYIVNQENGIIVKTGSVESLREAMESMIENKDHLAEMGIASRKMYEDFASMDKYKKDINKMIEYEMTRHHNYVFYRIFKENLLIDFLRNLKCSASEFINNGMCESIKLLRENYNSDILVKIEQRVKTDGDLHDLRKLSKRPNDHITVSLTSYPPRIPNLHICIESLLNQKLKPDCIELYLAEEQFPGKEIDLPDNILKLQKKGLKIFWCEDLKPHKKYYFAFQNHPDSIIITADDDIIYDQYMISRLYRSYLRFPDCISCLRAHSITFNELGKLNPYNNWKWEDNSLLNKPSFQAIATGCSGVLYPPHSVNKEVFDKSNIRNLALMTDDLWLKAMELANDTPVVLEDKNKKLQYVDGSQESAISVYNTIEGNDQNLIKIINYYNDKFHTDFIKKLNTIPNK